MRQRLIELGFLSTLSLRRATANDQQGQQARHDFYPRSPCGERPAFDVLAVSALLISIHALLAESDNGSRRRTYQPNAFLSTLSLRRATISCAWSASKLGDFYPRSPCGERHPYSVLLCPLKEISIHALLAESDQLICVVPASRIGFLSTLSLRRAT